MGKSPRQLDDDQLETRLREEAEETRPGRQVEEEAPVDLEDPPVDLDIDGVQGADG